MKKYFKKFTVMVIALTMILASSVSVSANTLKQTAYTQIHLKTGYILGSYHPKKDPVKFSMTQKLGDIKVTHIGYDGYYYYEFFPKKTGKTTITTKSKYDNSKRIITIRKYNNPVSSIKIGNTTVKGSKFNKTDRLYLSYDKYVKQKNQLIITPKKGWEVNQIRTLNRSGSKEYQSLSIFDKNSIKPTGGKGNYKLSIEFRNTKINGGRITEEIVFK